MSDCSSSMNGIFCEYIVFFIRKGMARCFRRSRSETEKRASHSSSLGCRREYAEEKDTMLKRTGLPFRDAYKNIRNVPII